MSFCEELELPFPRFTAFGLAMGICCCLKAQKKDEMHLLLGSKDSSCLLGIKMKDLPVLPEVKTLCSCWRLQILLLP